MKARWTILLPILILATTLAAKDKAEAPDANVVRLLKNAGATSYAHKPSYGAGIRDVFLGYGEDDKPVVGVAVRDTRTYSRALTLVSVQPADGQFRILAAEIPTLPKFRGKSRDMAGEALKDIAGRTFKDEPAARKLVDAVSGATQYRQAIYVSYSVMTAAVIRELGENPAWERRPLP